MTEEKVSAYKATMRIKASWSKKEKQRSLAETASALSFICWRVGMNTLLNLENEGFQTTSNLQRLSVVEEIMAFLLQVTDRLVYESMDEESRSIFINLLAKKMADYVQDNARDTLGNGDHRSPFIKKLNQRAEDYSEFRFTDGKPGFNFTRFLGDRLTAVLGETDSKWITNHVQQIEVPEILANYNKGAKGLGVV